MDSINTDTPMLHDSYSNFKFKDTPIMSNLCFSNVSKWNA